MSESISTNCLGGGVFDAIPVAVIVSASGAPVRTLEGALVGP